MDKGGDILWIREGYIMDKGGDILWIRIRISKMIRLIIDEMGVS